MTSIESSPGFDDCGGFILPLLMKRNNGSVPVTHMLFRPSNLKLSSGPAFAVGVLLALTALIVRLISYPTITSDYTYFLAKWFDALHAHPGLTAFQYPFSDYAPLYLYLLKLLTFLPVYSLWSVKTLSLVFDVGVAYLVYRMLQSTTNYSRGVLFLCAAIVFAIPTAVINSSLWGQSDALYAVGIVGALFAMVTEKPRWAALSFTLAFAFKVQSVFFLPVLLGYFIARPAAWKELLWIPALYIVCVVPAWLGGAPFLSLLSVYVHQSSEYTSLNISSQSIFSFTDRLTLSQHAQDILFWVGIGVSAAIAAVMTYIASKLPNKPQTLLFWSLVCVIAVPYFLPRMHERYFYLADIISVIYALYAPRRWFVPVLVVASSLLAYMPFLSGQVPFFSGVHVDLRFPSILLALTLVSLIAALCYSTWRRRALSYEHVQDDVHGKGGGGGGNYALSLRKARGFRIYGRPVHRPDAP